MSSPDKRKYKRINSLNLSYVLVNGKKDADRQTMGRTLDVSEAGIRLETHLAVPVGTEMLLSIGLEDSVVDIRGRVVHSHQNEEGRYELGVQFTNIDPGVSDTLNKFIQTFKSQRGITD
jgi:c-di-GMP-binding flagellar brake protein YcgR